MVIASFFFTFPTKNIKETHIVSWILFIRFSFQWRVISARSDNNKMRGRPIRRRSYQVISRLKNTLTLIQEKERNWLLFFCLPLSVVRLFVSCRQLVIWNVETEMGARLQMWETKKRARSTITMETPKNHARSDDARTPYSSETP